MGGQAAQRTDLRRLASMALVVLVAVLCFVQAGGYSFVYDDNVQIVTNPRIRSFAGLGGAFSENFWAFNSPGSFSNYYRPLQTVSYMVAYAIGGLSPSVYHWINILMHVGASLAVFWLGCVMFQSSTIALSGALLFAAHPMHTESVTWVAGLTDVACGLFYFVALACHLQSRKTDKGWRWTAAAAAAFLIALLYKEMALTLPIALLLFENACEAKPLMHDVWQRLLRIWPFWAVLALYVMLRINALGAFARASVPMSLNFSDRVLTMVQFLARYVQDLLIPVRQNAFHVFRPFSHLSWSERLVPIAVMAAVAAVIWRSFGKDRKAWALGLFIPLSLVPVLYFSAIGQNVYTERYLYIPSMSFCLLAGFLLHRFGPVRLPVLSLLVVVLSVMTIMRNPIWRDNKTLYSETLLVSPDSAPFHNNLGTIRFFERDLPSARREFEAALDAASRSYISFARDRATSLLGLSAIAHSQGNLSESWNYAEQARLTMPELADSYEVQGMLMSKLGKHAEAEKLLRYALKLQPNNVAAHVNLGNIFFARNDLPAAEAEFRQAVLADPASAGARVSLALLLARTNRIKEAVSLLREAVRLEPANPDARRILQQIMSERQQ